MNYKFDVIMESDFDIRSHKKDNEFLRAAIPYIVLYCNIWNNGDESFKIVLKDSIFITNKGEEIMQELTYNEFLSGSDEINPNTFKKAALLFYEHKLSEIAKNDQIFIHIDLPEFEKTFKIKFKFNGIVWEKLGIEDSLLINIEKEVIRNLVTYPDLESRCGISLQNISCKLNNEENSKKEDRFHLFYEISALSGKSLIDSLDLHCVIYDSNSVIISEQLIYIDKDKFFGFKIEKFTFSDLPIRNISKIKIYPSIQ